LYQVTRWIHDPVSRSQDGTSIRLRPRRCRSRCRGLSMVTVHVVVAAVAAWYGVEHFPSAPSSLVFGASFSPCICILMPLFLELEYRMRTVVQHMDTRQIGTSRPGIKHVNTSGLLDPIPNGSATVGDTVFGLQERDDKATLDHTPIPVHSSVH
jgi:hypothetical protein